jgi:hypothetical protein
MQNEIRENGVLKYCGMSTRWASDHRHFRPFANDAYESDFKMELLHKKLRQRRPFNVQIVTVRILQVVDGVTIFNLSDVLVDSTEVEKLHQKHK